MKIAIDAMGGDYAPKAICEGVVLARQEFPEIEFLLFGKKEMIQEYFPDKTNIQIIHTDEKIESDDEPVKSVRRKKNASMVLAAKAVKEGQADAMFSAGNTGALLVAGLLIIGRLATIERPGLISTLPVMSKDQSINGFDLIDMGANAENTPEHLLKFGILGSYYAKNVRKVSRPRVGLLNNGTEETKGSELTKKAYELLKAETAINFIGNVESRDLLQGVADVVVTDGFTGNAVLKSIEGTAMAITGLLKESLLNGGAKSKIGALLIKDSLKDLKSKMDYSSFGGAVLFGLKAPVVKTHGSTGPEAVAHTIRQIHTMVESNVIDELVTYFDKTNDEVK